MKITSLLTPLIRKEIPDLLRWTAFCPRPFLARHDNRSLVWHLSIDDEWSQAEMEDVLNFTRNSELKSAQVIFHSLKLSPEESVYLRNIKRAEPCDLPYGSKSGPNKQFYKSLKSILEHGNHSSQDALILLEVDAVPVRQGWLTLLNQALKTKPDFLIAGSRYQGGSQLSPRINQHFNGNAIYGIGSQGFREFLLGWESLLKAIVPECHWIAYDFCLEWITNAPSGHNVEIIQQYLPILNQYKRSSVDMSDYIANVSGHHEVSANAIPLEAIRQSHLIIHSKPLSKQIDYVIARSDLAHAILSRNHPLNVKLEALAKGPYEYLSSPHPNSFSSDIANNLVQNQIHTKDPLVCSMVRSCIRKPSS